MDIDKTRGWVKVSICHVYTELLILVSKTQQTPDDDD